MEPLGEIKPLLDSLMPPCQQQKRSGRQSACRHWKKRAATYLQLTAFLWGLFSAGVVNGAAAYWLVCTKAEEEEYMKAAEFNHLHLV